MHIVRGAHDQGCTEVRDLPCGLGKVRIVTDVDPKTQAGDLEDGAVVSSVENLFAAKEVRLAVATDQGATIHNDCGVE